MKMIFVIFGLILLYLVSLHTSIAGMELFGWLLFVSWLLLEAKNYWKRPKEILIGGDIFLWLMVLNTALGVGLSEKTEDFFVQFGFMRWVLLLYALTHLIRRLQNELDPKYWFVFWRVWSTTAIVVSLYALLQALTGFDLLGHKVSPYHGLFKATGTFNMSLTFAYTMGISTLMLVGRSLWLPAMAGAVSLAVSLARGAWMGMIPALFALLFYKFGKKVLLHFIATIGALLVGASFMPGIQERLMTFSNITADTSVTTRFSLWKSYWQIFLDHPIFGVGLFNGKLYLEPYYEKFQIGYRLYSHAHNNWLYMLAGTGLVGTLLFLAWNVFIWKTAIQLLRTKDFQDKAIVVSILAVQIFWQLGGLTECNFTDGEVNHFIVFTWAMLFAYRAKPEPR